MLLVGTKAALKCLVSVSVLVAVSQALAAKGLEQELNRHKSALRSYRVADQVVTGRAFYLSQETGDDRRTEAQAGDSTTPWESLDRLKAVALRPGDAVLLHAGDTFPGTLVLEGKGTLEKPIMVGRYGSGPAPLLTGRQAVSSWTSAGKPGVWRSPWHGKMPTGLWTRGQTRLSRYPQEGWLHLDSVLAPDRFLSKGLKSLDHGIVCMQFVPWSFAYQWISSWDHGAIGMDAIPEFPNLPGSTSRRMEKGNAFFLLNIPKMVEKEGDWAWDRQSKTLYLASSQMPKKVSVDALDQGVLIKNAAFMRVFGIACRGYRKAGVKIQGSNHIELDGLQLDSTGSVGIEVNGDRNIKIRHCRIAFARDRGMILTGIGIAADSSQIENVGLEPNAFLPFMEDTLRKTSRNLSMGNGIFSNAKDVMLCGNVISEVGYNGILFSGRNHRIEGNVVTDFCQTLDDGGGIYTGGKESPGGVIRRNIVGYIHSPAKKGWTHGIYLDDFSEGHLVDSNEIWNVQLGIMLHNARQNFVLANEIHVPWRAGINFQEDKRFSDYSRDNEIKGNRIHLTGETKAGVMIWNQHSNHPVGNFVDNIVDGDTGASAKGREVLLDGKMLDWSGLENMWRPPRGLKGNALDSSGVRSLGFSNGL